jgi:hypothetical protein
VQFTNASLHRAPIPLEQQRAAALANIPVMPLLW